MSWKTRPYKLMKIFNKLRSMLTTSLPRVPEDTARAMVQAYLIAPSEALANMKLDYPVSSRVHPRKPGADHPKSGSIIQQPNIPQSGSKVNMLSTPAVSQPRRPDAPLPSGPPVALLPRSIMGLPPANEHKRRVYAVDPEHIWTNPPVHANGNL